MHAAFEFLTPCGSRPGHGLLSAQDTRYHALNISGVAAGTHALELQESSVA